MPTLNPRITVTLQPQTFAVMRELSQLTGNSQSALIGELLQESLPIFERMCEVLRAAKKLEAEAMETPSKLRQSLEHTHARVSAQLGLALDEADTAMGSILDEAEKVARRRGRAPQKRVAPAKPTPLSNRGVTHPPGYKSGRAKGAGHKGRK